MYCIVPLQFWLQLHQTNTSGLPSTLRNCELWPRCKSAAEGRRTQQPPMAAVSLFVLRCDRSTVLCQSIGLHRRPKLILWPWPLTFWPAETDGMARLRPAPSLLALALFWSWAELLECGQEHPHKHRPSTTYTQMHWLSYTGTNKYTKSQLSGDIKIITGRLEFKCQTSCRSLDPAPKC